MRSVSFTSVDSTPPRSEGIGTAPLGSTSTAVTPTPTIDIGSEGVHRQPPYVKQPYLPSDALDDLPGAAYALEVFLASRMLESEDYCHKSDPTKQRLYFSTGYGLIQCVKGMMSFEDEDLLTALGHVKHGNNIANQHRKKQASLATRLAGYVSRSSSTSGVGFIKSMTTVERHAELVYAESLFEKALLGILYSGDWLAFVKETLNMRSTFNIYRQLGKFIEAMDAEAQARGDGPQDNTIDIHFRSGVYLGVGMSHLSLSMMPSKIMTIVELFGFKGDRRLALEFLYKVGGWSSESPSPVISAEQEGIRRSTCDMILLCFHLYLSDFTFNGVDVIMAQKILEWNLKRYPNGVFFLLAAGRLSLVRSQPRLAIEYYIKAVESQSQYRNIHHLSFWEISIASLAVWDIPKSMSFWTTLEAEATWSKATYTYGLAVCKLEIATEKELADAAELMMKVPDLKQRIAGKSIPLEKFVSRKARKFTSQGGRLALPGLELAYFFLAIAHSPSDVILSQMVPLIETQLSRLQACGGDPSKYDIGNGYWDDYCLARFLEGVCWRYIAYPDPDAIEEQKSSVSPEYAGSRSQTAFDFVITNGSRIELDHYLVYHTHFELGRLLSCQGDFEGARHEFELVLSGKPLEVNSAGKKGKYSMESSLHIRTHAALEALHQRRL